MIVGERCSSRGDYTKLTQVPSAKGGGVGFIVKPENCNQNQNLLQSWKKRNETSALTKNSYSTLELTPHVKHEYLTFLTVHRFLRF